MKILSLFLFFSTQLFAVCEFRPEIKNIYSLSGSVTVALKELGLLNQSELKGISVFHPISEKEFSGEFLPGGVFLSYQKINQLTGSTVFYDESRELAKILDSTRSIRGIQIKTRGLLPHEVIQTLNKTLAPFVRGCEAQFQKLSQKILDLENQLEKALKAPIAVVFFLGDFNRGRPAEFVIANDGVVKLLVLHKKIISYPSSLAYVNWSAKVLKDMPNTTLLVGVSDSGKDLVKEIKRNGSKQMTLIYPGALIPGLSQVEAWLYWAKSL
ncbi:MAG: hypothetical protein AB7I27_19330 [Bacteriovoracaceae bacterium]